MARQQVNYLRIAVLGALLLAALAFTPAGRKAFEAFDSRPPVHILFIGNSHTFVNDMPGMVRRIADSAGVKQRYDITAHAVGGATFKNDWENSGVQALLKQPWDHVILQGGSSETLSEPLLRDFLDYGARLAVRARETGGKRWLYVTWRYAPGNEWILENPQFDHTMQAQVQAGYRQLSQATATPLINVGKVWNEVETSRPGFTLYQADGNHASMHGSYLAALMMFSQISGASPETTRYRPSGMSEDDADYLRAAAAGRVPERIASLR